MAIQGVVIARNEQRAIARCLRSAARFVDGLIVLDTGSVDDTISIAESEGATVYRYPWQHDFAAARNHVLGLAANCWRLVLDADEWVESGGDNLRSFVDALGSSCCVGQVRIRHGFEVDSLIQYAPSWTSRLLPPYGVWYEGKIHEQAIHSWPVHRIDVTVGHDGFLPAQQAMKGHRNLELLSDALRQSPQNAYLRFQLGREHQSRLHFAEAADAYIACRSLLDWQWVDLPACRALVQRFPWLHDLSVRLIFCLKRADRLTEIPPLLSGEASIWSMSPDFHFAAADALLAIATAHPEQAMALFPQMEQHWIRCLEIGETPDLEGHVEGRGSALAAHNLETFRRLKSGSGF